MRPRLDVPNPELKRRLPPHGSMACDQASSNGDVNCAFPHAIELSGALRSNGVMGAEMAVIGVAILLPLLIFVWPLQLGTEVWLILMFGALTLALLHFTAIGVRHGFCCLLDEPILFNRATRKVHVFRVRRRQLNPFVPWPLSIESYDWDCVHAEIAGKGNPEDAQFPNYVLHLAITDAPDSGRVLDRFVVGGSDFTAKGISRFWEHIRRFMEEGGPALPPGEKLKGRRTFSHAAVWIRYFPVLDPRRGVERFGRLGFGLKVVAGFLFFPVVFLMALGRWLGEWSCREAVWPAEVRATLGGPELAAEEVEMPAPPVVRGRRRS